MAGRLGQPIQLPLLNALHKHPLGLQVKTQTESHLTYGRNHTEYTIGFFFIRRLALEGRAYR